jgi:SAM-dependent methyltransferase
MTTPLELTAHTARGTENLEVMREAVRYNAWLADLVRAHLGPARRVLDFGAGRGTFARLLHGEAAREVTCVEPDPDARRELAAAGLECHASVTALPCAHFDAVYTLNVLEHVADDVAALQGLWRCLRPGGRLFVYVPAFQLLYSSMDRRVGHLRRYRRKVLLERVHAAGFVTQRARYADSLGFFATLAYKALGDREGQIDRNALRLYDRLAFPVSRVLDRLVGRAVGKNVWVSAHRPPVSSGEGAREGGAAHENVGHRCRGDGREREAQSIGGERIDPAREQRARERRECGDEQRHRRRRQHEPRERSGAPEHEALLKMEVDDGRDRVRSG